MMKKLIIVLIGLVALSYASSTNAMIIPTETIGWAQSDGIWNAEGPGTAFSIYPYLSQGNKGGIARRFNLTDYYVVTATSGFLTGQDYLNPDDLGGATFTLHKGSGYRTTGPNFYIPSNNIIYESQKFTVPQVAEGSWYGESDLDLTLAPGDYWFGAYGGAQLPGRILVSDYKLEGRVTTPEPASMLLLGGGLLGAFWRRRKVSKV